MYKTVIFDLDGTLLDSLNDILSVLNNTLTHFGLPQITRNQAQSFIGNGARELVRLAIGEVNSDRLDEILSYYKERYAQSDNKLSRIYDGEYAALKNLKSAGVKLAILTNKPHSAAMRANSIFFENYAFDCIVGQADGVPLKPDPQAVYNILEKLGAKKEDCLFVGDGETDVLTAKNAGIDCASVLWGYRDKAALQSVGATLFVNSYPQLERLILD